MWGNTKSCPGKKMKSCAPCSRWQILTCGCWEWALTATSRVGLFLFLSVQPGIALPLVWGEEQLRKMAWAAMLSTVTFPSASDAGWQLEELQDTLIPHQIQPKNRIMGCTCWWSWLSALLVNHPRHLLWLNRTPDLHQFLPELFTRSLILNFHN